MEYYSAFLLQLNMEPCFSADTPPLSGIHIKQLSPHLYMALFPQIIITPLSGTYSFFTIPPLYDTIFYILLSHLNMVSFSLFLSRLYMTLILFIITRQYYSPQLLQGFSAEGFSRSFSLSTSLLHIFPWLFFR